MGKKGSTETTTNWISPEDQARIRQGRTYGDLASQAHRGVQEAGVDPNSRNALNMLYDYYGQMGGLGGDMYGRGMSALDYAGQTGAEGINQFLNPYVQGQLDPMRQMFGDMRADQYSGAGQDATQAGAYGGSRHAMLAAKRLGNIDQQQAQYEGGLWNQSYRDAMQAMLGERGRMQGLGLGMMDRYQRTADAQRGAAGGIAGMGDYFRNIQQMQNERQAKNLSNAAQMQMGTYGKDIESGQTKETKKGWAEGLLPMGMNIAKMFIPGGQAAGAAGMFSQLFGGGGGAQGPGGQAPGQSAYLNQMAADPWQGMNLGGSSSPGYGGYGGGGALFNPAPPGGFFSGAAGPYGY